MTEGSLKADIQKHLMHLRAVMEGLKTLNQDMDDLNRIFKFGPKSSIRLQAYQINVVHAYRLLREVEHLTAGGLISAAIARTRGLFEIACVSHVISKAPYTASEQFLAGRAVSNHQWRQVAKIAIGYEDTPETHQDIDALLTRYGPTISKDYSWARGFIATVRKKKEGQIAQIFLSDLATACGFEMESPEYRAYRLSSVNVHAGNGHNIFCDVKEDPIPVLECDESAFTWVPVNFAMLHIALIMRCNPMPSVGEWKAQKDILAIIEKGVGPFSRPEALKI